MAHVSTERVIATLERLRKGVCGYLGNMCDCKFGYSEEDLDERKKKWTDEGKALYLSVHGEQTGCPELRQAIDELRNVDALKKRIAELEADPEAEAQRRLDKKMAALGYVPEGQ